ncbi:MAG: glycosyltransferase [Alphaproteobacteria bacterium]|nr:glycosyltransferase [Alphaproteobacteria bacterium]
MTQPLISVIVPIYNVETYLKGCLESILHQTEPNFEAILVDDGSTDRSGLIADEYARKDPRFKVIHQENKGLSGARNTGLKVAEGIYVAFLDSDDYWHPEFLRVMSQTAQKERADLVVCKLQHTDKFYHQMSVSHALPNFKIQRFYKPLDGFLENKDLASNVCVKLHRREAIQNLFFKEGIYFEDVLFSTLEMSQIKYAVYVNVPLYYYFANPQSIMRSSFTDEKVESYVITIFELYQYFKANKPAYLKKVQKQIINKRVKMCMNQAIRKQRSNYRSQMLFVKMAQEFKILYREGIISFDGLKVHQKMALALLIHNNPKAAWLIMKYL